MKRFFFNGIVCLTAAFGLIFISCPNGNSEEWTNISSVNDIAGKWGNTFVVNVPATGYFNAALQVVFGVPIPATSVSYEDFLLEYTKNEDTLTISSKTDFNILLEDVIKTNKGYTKDSLWENLISFYDPLKDDIAPVKIEKYYVIQKITRFISNLDISSFYINEDQTKLKMVVPLDTYKQEIILNKII
jgi:hypothetical protein